MTTHRHPELIFGAALVGVSYPTAESVTSILATLSAQDISALDTAARYPPNSPGLSESLLGAAAAASSFAIDTKVLTLDGGAGSLTPAAARASVEASSSRLGAAKVRTLYVHWPDRATPFAEQAAGLAALHREGRFEQLGVSNFSAAEVEAFAAACEAQGCPPPAAYQGEYSVIARAAEADLMAVLRRRGIRFVAYRALAAGFLKGGAGGGGGEGTRFEEGHPFAEAMNKLYGGEGARRARELVAEALAQDTEPLDPLDAAIRWICYHSALSERDAVILGASRAEQVVRNVEAIRRGPLPHEVARRLSGVWEVLQAESG